MNKLNPFYWWRRLLALPNESRIKTLAVAFLVALVCALIVSVTTTLLKPRQEANLLAQRQEKMDAMIASLPGMAGILLESGADSLETMVINLDSGAVNEQISPADFDFRSAIKDENLTIPIDKENDVAGIGRRPANSLIYLVRRDNEIALLVLPVYGKGYQSTIHAYLALGGDFNTIAALNIYEQNETPGLGTRITEPAWQATWVGRKTRDENGNVKIVVVKGASSNAYEIDGISGATRSATGVSNLVQFWLGENGYGPLLKRMKLEGM